MKKLLGFIFIALTAIGITACTIAEEDQTLSSSESLSSMAYLSANYLSMSSSSEAQGLAFNLSDDALEVEEELEEVNEYLTLLKNFMDNGAKDFGSITEEESDRAEYVHMITIIVAEETYTLYYNIDAETDEITGIFVLGEVEYSITAYNYLEDKDEFDDDDDDDDEFDDQDDDDDEFDDEDDEDEDDLSYTQLSETTVTTETETTDSENTEVETTVSVEQEEKMELIARNGDDYIKITYKVETEDEEVETKFEMETFIGGVEKEISIEIKEENNEYKIEIEDGENSYEFKREIEDGGIKYELEYEVNGTEGEIEIFESTNELGETVYRYEIEEEGKYKEVEIDEDDHDEDDSDDDDSETIV